MKSITTIQVFTRDFFNQIMIKNLPKQTRKVDFDPSMHPSLLEDGGPRPHFVSGASLSILSNR